MGRCCFCLLLAHTLPDASYLIVIESEFLLIVWGVRAVVRDESSIEILGFDRVFLASDCAKIPSLIGKTGYKIFFLDADWVNMAELPECLCLVGVGRFGVGVKVDLV